MGSAASWPSRERRSRERAREATRSETTASAGGRTRGAESRNKLAVYACGRCGCAAVKAHV